MKRRSDFTRTTDVDQPLNGNFPYYSDGVAGESYGPGDYKATNGRLYKVSASGAGTPLAWYPAPGYRDYGRPSNEGVALGIGGNGFCWLSAVSGTSGIDLGFNMPWLTTSNMRSRGYGFQLRCLSE